MGEDSRSIGTNVGENPSEGVARLPSDPGVQLGAGEYPRCRERENEDEELRKVEKHYESGGVEGRERAGRAGSYASHESPRSLICAAICACRRRRKERAGQVRYHSGIDAAKQCSAIDGEKAHLSGKHEEEAERWGTSVTPSEKAFRETALIENKDGAKGAGCTQELELRKECRANAARERRASKSSSPPIPADLRRASPSFSTSLAPTEVVQFPLNEP